jgi:hypothetical protein
MPYEVAIHVVDVTAIKSVTSVQPHDYETLPGEHRYFIWHQIGLDISVLGGMYEALDNYDKPFKQENL